MPDFTLETEALAGRAGGRVAGLDEVGRGPLAGPVVAAAAVLHPRRLPPDLLAALDDSKALSAKRRLVLFDRLRLEAAKGGAELGVGAASVREIDRLNILQASLLAMRRAYFRLPVSPDFALVDGKILPGLPGPARAVVGGDGKSLSIAAASIIAKVLRDRMMERLARRYPGFGWEKNAGYPTALHLAALRSGRVTPHHRRSFAPVLESLTQQELLSG